MAVLLTQNSYGKSRVRLTRVTRIGDRHEIRELTVGIRLEGAFEGSYTLGDNSRIIATDTMKNVVYALAQGRPSESIEQFGEAIAGHFVGEFSHVDLAEITLAEHPWARVGGDHPHAFTSAGGEVRTAVIAQRRDGLTVEAGLEGLSVLKTTRSGFSGFLRDRFTTLPETEDRILATEVRARWRYGPGLEVAWDDAHARARNALIATFAAHDSLAVQQTLHAMGEAALEACPEAEEITLTLPNQHRIPVDLARFGRPNENEIFVATEEPFGLISGTLRRG